MFEAFEKYLKEKADLHAGEIDAVRAVSIEKRSEKDNIYFRKEMYAITTVLLSKAAFACTQSEKTE